MNNVIPLARQPRHDQLRPPKKPEPATYTVAQVAQLLNLSLGSTYNLIRMGEIPARQLGNRWVISKKRFHAWLDEEQDQLSTQDDYVQEGRY